MWNYLAKRLAVGLIDLGLERISQEIDKNIEGRDAKDRQQQDVVLKEVQEAKSGDVIVAAANAAEEFAVNNDREKLRFGAGTGFLYIPRSHSKAPPQWRGNPTVLLPPGYRAKSVALVGAKGEYELEGSGLANPWHDQGEREHWRSRKSPRQLRKQYGKQVGIRIDGKLVAHHRWGKRGE